MSELLVSTSGFDGRGDQPHSSDSEVSPTCRREGGAAPRSADFPSMMSRPGSSDACATIVQGLMHFNLSSDDEFSRKACESLVKKMKDKRDELDALIVSVYSRGDDSKKCITIARTLDGRLQVAGRKGFPHVVYAKIFRWPDLHKNELKHLPLCENAFDLKADNVCVNPYHYERVLNAGMGPMDLKGDDDDIIVEDSRPYMNMNQRPMTSTSQMQGMSHNPMPPPRVPPMQQKPMISPNSGHFTGNRFLNFNNQMVHQHPMMQMNQLPQHSMNQMPPPQLPMTIAPQPPHMMQQAQNMPSSSTMSMAPTTTQLPPAPPFQPPKAKPTSMPVSTILDLVIEPQGRYPASYRDMSNIRFQQKNQVCVTHTEPPDASTMSTWASMVYHERTKTISQFQAKMNTMYIDGGYATGGNRWCLGNEDNQTRDEDTNLCRSHIGKGVRLSYKENGDVWIQVYSHICVYVQSHYLDRESGRSAGDVVHKLYPGARIKLFDLEKCCKTLKEQWLSNLMAKCRMASSRIEDDDAFIDVNGEGTADEPVRLLARNDATDPLNELLRYCLARISFMRGWGPDYENRSSITDCPCWVEIKMNQAYAFLDHLLTEVTEPENVNPM